MTPLRIVGGILVALGLVALLWGGVFWRDRDTVFQAGPLEVQTESQEGFSVPPVLGAISIVAGIILLVIPARRRV